jgi:hypothetical protein
MHIRRLLPLLLVAAAPLAGCAGETDDRPREWSYISATIIQPNCASSRCHSQFTSTAGLRLDSVEGGYVGLVGGGFVVPGEADRSKLLFMLRGEEVWTMPPDLPLPEADILLIERWIDEGAKDN